MEKFLNLDPSNKEKLKSISSQQKSQEISKKSVKLWIEKYRPNNLSQIISQDHVVSALKTALETGRMPHLLFYGPPGTGKTSAILAILGKL